MDDNVHQRQRPEIEEDGRPSGAAAEQLGPELRGKSLAEIAAILMRVPTPGEDGTPGARFHSTGEGHPLSIEESGRSAAAQASITTPPSAIAAPLAPPMPDAPAPAPGAIDRPASMADVVRAPPMAPGIGGPNIELPPASAGPIEDCGVARGWSAHLSPDPAPVPTPLIPTQRKPRLILVAGVLLAVIFTASAGVAMLSINGVRKDAGAVAGSPTIERSSDSIADRIAPQPARLFVEAQKGFANERLPLGVSLDGGSGSEWLELSGLAAGTKLSAGSPVGPSAWRMSPHDLDQAFAYAPKDFIGVMDAAIQLRSAADELIDRQVVRLEWIENKDSRLTSQPDQSSPPPAIQPSLGPVQITMLIERAAEFLKQGDIAAARTSLRRAANAGSAQAALELGMTFDQTVLLQRGVLGFVTDVAQAREWYGRAIKLGSPDAHLYLERLTAASK